MHQIDTANAVTVPPAVLAPGPVPDGYFQPGNPGAGQPATSFDQDWCNMVQAELAAFLAAAGVAQVKGTFNQVLTSVLALFARRGAHGQCILTTTGATNLTLLPKNGANIVIDGAQYQIPSAGIAALTTSCYVNGVAAQALAASTLYYIYLFDNAGTPTLDFSITGHATDTTAGNVGVEIKAGDSTRTLVGMIFTDAAAHVNDTPVLRNLATWFNRRDRSLEGAGTAGVNPASTVLVDLGAAYHVECVSWSSEAVDVAIVGSMSNGNAGGSCSISIGIDGASAGSGTTFNSAQPGYNGAAASTYTTLLAEGHHVIAIFGSNASGTVGSISASITGISRG